jgi:hypothetical protein
MVILKDKWVEEDINHRSRFDPIESEDSCASVADNTQPESRLPEPLLKPPWHGEAMRRRLGTTKLQRRRPNAFAGHSSSPSLDAPQAPSTCGALLHQRHRRYDTH